jgi:hypothetical protein
VPVEEPVTAILAIPPTGLEVFRARLHARLYLWAAGEIDDLAAAMDELLVDVFHYATLGERIDDTVDELERAWCLGGAAALDEPKNVKLLRTLWGVQLDELQRRIDAIKAERRGRTQVDRRRTPSS